MAVWAGSIAPSTNWSLCAVRSAWSPMRVEPSKLELVRFATLAANSHNTQPWKFSIKDNSIAIAPDYARRCPDVDPDDHHLFVSLGCATENLVHAAAAHGLKSTPVFENDVVTIMFEKSQPISSPGKSYSDQALEPCPARSTQMSLTW